MAEYEAWFATLPADAARGGGREAGARRRASGTSTATTSCSPGCSSATSSSPSSRRAATARTRWRSTTTPSSPPAHHYLASYRWLRTGFGADAIVHLGKHGTLEWLPGKGLGLGPASAPDAALAGVPLFYPFVVNDPGEGVQAKRRAHAVIVDHLVPPMMRAETYDELAELEQLLDEYARCEALDPPKLPALAGRIWTLLHEAELHHDLDLEAAEQPSLDDFGALIEHIDGYLCEIKDLQIRDGLHVLGAAPEGEQFDGLLAAMLRLGARERVPGLRRAVGAAYGLDEPALLEDAAPPGRRAAGAARALPRAVDAAAATSWTGWTTRRGRCSAPSRRAARHPRPLPRPAPRCSATRTPAS